MAKPLYILNEVWRLIRLSPVGYCHQRPGEPGIGCLQVVICICLIWEFGCYFRADMLASVTLVRLAMTMPVEHGPRRPFARHAHPVE